MEVSDSFTNFFENTKNIYTNIGIILIIIIFFFILPIPLDKTFKQFSKVFIILGICYLLFKNTIETNILLKKNPDVFHNNNLIAIKNSIIFSYCLSIILLILIIYIFYIIFR